MRANEKRIVDFAYKEPTAFDVHTREYVNAGGLMSYSADDAGQLTGVPPIMWTKFLKEPSLPTSPWSNRQSSSW